MRWPDPLVQPGHPLQLVLGPLVWAAWFVAVYAGLSLGCTLVPPAGEGAFTWLNGLLLVVTLAVTALLLACARRSWRTSRSATEQRRFVAWVAAGIYLYSAVATLLVGAPAVVLPPCL